jgi:hypothetical protein
MGSSVSVDVDCNDIDAMQCLVEFTFSASATAGATLDLYAGFGGADPAATIDSGTGVYTVIGGSSVIKFGDNSESVTLTSFAANTTKRTSFYINEIGVRWPRWIRFKFTNSDALRNHTVTCYGDL